MLPIANLIISAGKQWGMTSNDILMRERENLVFSELISGSKRVLLRQTSVTALSDESDSSLGATMSYGIHGKQTCFSIAALKNSKAHSIVKS